MLTMTALKSNQEDVMAVLTIRNVDDAIKSALRVQAAQHGVSMEEQARCILRDALTPAASPAPMGERLLRRFADVASDDFSLPPRSSALEPRFLG